MIVSLAVYSKEAQTALSLLQWISDLGGVSHHTLVLATTPQVNPAPLIAEAASSWGKVEHFVIATNQEIQPWPIGNNSNFLAVCEYMKNKQRPFFFMESDILPTNALWLDNLEREYQACGKPFMGLVHPMVGPDNMPMKDTLHMNGAGVYPADVLIRLPTLPFITGPLAKEAWDIALRWEILYVVDGAGGFKPGPDNGRVSGCHATDSICFAWRSRNYRLEDGVFACDCDSIHYSRLNLQKHLLHHGCKDESLLKILRHLLNMQRGIVETPAAPAAPAPVAPPAEVPQPAPAKAPERLAAALRHKPVVARLPRRGGRKKKKKAAPKEKAEPVQPQEATA